MLGESFPPSPVRTAAAILAVGLTPIAWGWSMLDGHPNWGVLLMAGGAGYLLYEITFSPTVRKVVPEGMLRLLGAVMLCAVVIALAWPSLKPSLLNEGAGLRMRGVIGIFDKQPELPTGLRVGNGNDVSGVTMNCGGMEAGNDNKLSNLHFDNSCTLEQRHEYYKTELAKKRVSLVNGYKSEGMRDQDMRVKLNAFDTLVAKLDAATDEPTKFDIFVCALMSNCTAYEARVRRQP